jgi:SnoaL-like domain
VVERRVLLVLGIPRVPGSDVQGRLSFEASRDTAGAMSEENVELVLEHVERFGKLRPEDIPQHVARFWDPDSDFYPVRKFPEARPCHGREEIARFIAEFLNAWDNFEFVPKNSVAVGDDRVLAQTTLRGEGRESGMRLDGDVYHCVWLRRGRVFRWEDHLTEEGAIQALGLSAEALKATGLSE